MPAPSPPNPPPPVSDHPHVASASQPSAAKSSEARITELQNYRITELQSLEVTLALVGGDDPAVVLPLAALVAKEEVEDMFAQHLGDQFRLGHHLDCLGQVLRQGLVPHGTAFGARQRPHVILGAGRQ